MIGQRLGLFPRWLAWLGYLVALVLLFVSGNKWQVAVLEPNDPVDRFHCAHDVDRPDPAA